jgi:hypothetical protein
VSLFFLTLRFHIENLLIGESIKEMQNKCLTVLCAGDTSLHEKNRWSMRDTRNFDLCIVYYGSDDKVFTRYKNDADRAIRFKGMKWENVWHVFSAHQFWKEYDYIWIPDDDLLVDVEGVNKMFYVVTHEQIPLSQPSLLDVNVSHKVLIHDRHHLVDTKDTSFVEIQMPCFDKRTLEDVFIPILRDCHAWNKSGWGFDFYWSQRVSGMKLINCVSVLHTKPVDTNAGFYKANDIDPHRDLKLFQKRYEHSTD